MQIANVEVVDVELKLRQPMQFAGLAPIQGVTAIFLRIETRQGATAWGCTVAHRELTGEDPAEVLRVCRECAELLLDLHPLNIEYTLGEIAAHPGVTPSVLCAFDLALHDLISLVADMPLYRLLGGYRNRIQTSATIPIASLGESVQIAQYRARNGFRMLKVKGGMNAEEDVQRVQAIHRALPNHILRLDADGGYSVQDALDVTRALQDVLEMIEQPTGVSDPTWLKQVKDFSPVPVLADQSIRDTNSALNLAANRMVDGVSIKLATCGGLRCARQIDAIARAAHIASMVSCFVEPALMICAGLSMALSSPNVRYGDLDGNLDLLDDPSQAGFTLEDGWLVARDVPGLGYTVNLS